MIKKTNRDVEGLTPGGTRQPKRTKNTYHGLLDFERVISEHFPGYKDFSVIDVGGEDGWLGEVMSFRNYTYVDIVYAGSGENLVCADGAHLPFKDYSFDLGICKQVLPQTEDPLGICMELKRVSKNGVIIRQELPTGDCWKFKSNIDSIEDIACVFMVCSDSVWKWKYELYDFIAWRV